MLIAAAVLAPFAAWAERKAPTKENFPWLGNPLGISTEVPKPWTPVEVDGSAVRVWGREIRYADSLLPVQITSQGVELLAKPVALDVRAGGKPMPPGKAAMKVVSKRGDQVVIKAVAESAKLRVETLTTIEFDGMVKIALTLTPKPMVTVDSVRLVVPVAEQVAKAYGRYLDYDFEQLRTNKMSFISCMQIVKDRPILCAFNPEIYLGNREVGLTWAAETNRYWDLEDEAKAISVEPGNGRTDLVVNFIDHRVTLLKPRTIEFGFFPTPLKPVDPRMRQIRLAAFGRIRTAIQSGVSRSTYDYYSIAWQSEVQPVYTSLPMSAKNERHLRTRKMYKDYNCKYIPYGALWYTNAVMDAGRSFYPDWHIKRAGTGQMKKWKLYDAGETKDQGRGHWDGYRVCPGPKSYADFIVWTYTNAIKPEGMDGIYFDHGGVSHACENPNHDHCKTADRKLFFGVFHVRELLKRLWISTKAIKPDLVIIQHQARTLKSLNSFIDISATGEVMNVVFANSASSRGVREDPTLYVPDYARIPEPILDYDSLPTMGFECRLLPQIKYCIEPYWKQHPDLYDFYSHKMFRYTLLRGIRHWAGNMSQTAINEAWLALDKIGRLDAGVTFHPYWTNQGTVVCKHSTTRVSYYRRPGKLLLIAGNTNGEDVKERIQLKLDTRFRRATDAVTGKPVARMGGRPVVDVPAHLYRAVLLER